MARTNLSTICVAPEQMTDKMRAFVSEYVVDYNAVRAARAAGYAQPHAAGGKLVKNKLVAAAIGKIQSDNLERLELKREAIVDKLACVALRDPIDLCDANGQIVVNDLRKLPKRIRVCIDSIKVRSRTDSDGNISQEVELKLAPTNPAMELALRHFGMLRDRLEVQDSAKMQIDYERLYRPPSESVDPVEQELLRLEAGTPAIVSVDDH